MAVRSDNGGSSHGRYCLRRGRRAGGDGPTGNGGAHDDGGTDHDGRAHDHGGRTHDNRTPPQR